MLEPWTGPTRSGPALRRSLWADLHPAIVLALASGCFFLDQLLLGLTWDVIGVAGALLGASILGVVVPVAVTCRILRTPLLPGTALYRIRAGESWLAVWATASVLAPSYAAGELVSRVLPPDPSIYEFYEALAPHGAASLLFGGVAVVVAAPLAEEIVFRALLLGTLLRFAPAALGVAASALLFAASHGALWFLLPISFLGTILALLVWRTGSLAPAWLGHGLFNLVGYTELCSTHDARAARLERWSLLPWVLVPSLISLAAAVFVLVRAPRPPAPRPGMEEMES